MANELVADVASATPLATILTRKLPARDLGKRSRGCSPVLARSPSRSMPGLNHGVAGLTPRTSRPSPTGCSGPPKLAASGRGRPRLSRMISSHWPISAAMVRNPAGVASAGGLPNDWAFVYFDGKWRSVGWPIELVDVGSARERNNLRPRAGLARRLRFNSRQRL